MVDCCEWFKVFINNNNILQVMQLPLQIYEWLVSSGIISNTGEQDEKGFVNLPQGTTTNFDNGFLVGEIIRKLTTDAGRKVPTALATVKADPSKNAKLTNWNFIWLAFDAIGLKLDTRIKELILQGQPALIVEVVRQLYERDEHRPTPGKLTVRMRSAGKQRGHTQAVDIKKINLSKDPQESESSLQFLMLLLKASLGMNLQEILGLFTNQNKYLAHIIVKGVAQSFDSIILFYSLLNKHASKLKAFYQQDSRDAQACLYALKPGFISKNQNVAQLALELFSKLGNIYQWFIGQEGKCAGTLLLGLKRHPALRELYWHLLLEIIQGEEVDFFAKHFTGSFQNQQQQIQIIGFLVRYIAQSWLGEKLSNMGVVATWIQTALKLPEANLEAQIICFRFVGELMLFLPEVVEQNEQAAQVFERKWYTGTLPQFAALLNELMEVLQKLGESRSSMAKRVFQAVVGVTRNVGYGDKRDYLVQNFLPLVPRFPSIPAQLLIQHLRHSPLSHSEYLLACETLQVSESVSTAISIGNFLKTLFLENPLQNFNLGRLLKEVAEKVMKQEEIGVPFLEKLLEEVLQLYGTLQVKYKPRPKQQQSMYFGRKGSPEKVSKQEEQDLIIKQKWKQLLLGLVLSLLDLFLSQQNEELKEMLKDKLLDGNANIRKNNHKVGSKAIEDILNKRFGISKEQQIQHAEQFTRKSSAELEESNIQKSKAASLHQAISSRLKGPQNLTKQFQLIIERRRQEQEQKKALELKKHLLQQKKKLSVKKELQITNLLRGQIGEAQLRQLGFLDRLMQEPKGQEVIPLDELQARDVDAVEAIFKNYHKVLRHLFLTYTWTMYNSHTNQKFEDNIQRKELLNVVELGRMLKDYRLAFLTSQPQLCTLVRDINVKLLGRKEVVNQLDYTGFEQFVIQFCALFMPRNKNRTIFTPDGPRVTTHDFSKEPLYVLVKEFFLHLKNGFLARGDKVAVFEDVVDVTMNKEQAYQVEIFNKKLQTQPNYILPKGYKKLAQHSVHFQHYVSPTIGGLPQAYAIAIEILDSIFSQQLGTHIIEDIAVKKTSYKVKPTAIALSGFPRERAMSTFIQRKSTTTLNQEIVQLKQRSASRGALPPPPQEKVKPKRTISLAKLQELQRAKFQSLQRKARQKQEERQAQLQLQKAQERKRKVQTQRFLQQQKARLAQRQKKGEAQRAEHLKELQQRQAMKRQNKQKFKAFHQNQLEKIKKVFQESQERQRRQKQEQQQERERQQELKRKLREKIQQQDKRLAELYKQAQKNMRILFQSESIKRTLARFQPNLRAIFDFLLQNTFLSITEKRHNNEVIFDTWRYFITAFELALIVNSKTTAHIFKALTRDKLVPKEYHIGLNFEEFQQALLRIVIKYKSIFNMVAEKIKDKQPSPEKTPVNEANKQKYKKGKKGKEGKQQKNKSKEKQHNQFDPLQQINIKQLIKQGQKRQPVDDFADITNVTDKTLLGLIYYLKVPNSKHGQEKRFRDILLNKQQPFAHNTERLKEKLKEEYTLEVPPKKPRASKSPPPQPIPPQKLIT